MPRTSAHQGDDAIAKPAPALRTFAHEALVGRDELAAAVTREGEIEAIICRMIELDCDACRGLQQGARGPQLDLRRLQQPSRENGFVRGKLAPPDLLPEDIRALGHQQLGRNERGAPAKHQRLRGTVFLDYPFYGDARIDDERAHRSLRPSRSSTSDGV